MFIIFIAHTPGNSWNDWIPARFGFSSGTELFVFCSGCASAGAFGRVFIHNGFLAGTLRIFKRIWQIYWVHICMVFACISIAFVASSIVGDAALGRFSPLDQNGFEAVGALVLLAWLPDYLDILPMYIVILGFVPLFELLARLHKLLPLITSASLWFYVHIFGLSLQGNPWTHDVWFLNPFAWQFCFMLGFSIYSGRLKIPNLGLPLACIVASMVLLFGFLFSFQPFVEHFEELRKIQAWLVPLDSKTNLAAIRLIHFLSLAYVIVSLVTPFADRLDRGLGRFFVQIGQQSLATFVMSIVGAQLGGFALQVWGDGAFPIFIVNFCGLLLLVLTARVALAFKDQPWMKKRVVA